MVLSEKKWIKISIFNLAIVALLGVVMRYKIAFNFPYLEQKNILHSHSHFAFSGWISQTLFLLITHLVSKHLKNIKKYQIILIANAFCAYGMLTSFLIQGYGVVSIIFSTLSILISFLFTYFFLKDVTNLSLKNPSINWLKAALFFNVISSFGTFFLAYMIANKNIVQDLYLSSIYFYLHFQYNGWFFFAIVGLFIERFNIALPNKKLNTIFWGLIVSCLVTFFLSVLWAKLPNWLYVITVISTLVQTIYWFKLQSFFIKYFKETKSLLKQLLIVVYLATNLKFLMQLGLIFPQLNNLVFGTRIIVIAYLHLVLLGIISLSLLYYLIITYKIIITRLFKLGVLTFTIGIILNEIILFTQGALSLFYMPFPSANELLFIIGLILLMGILMILYGFSNQKIIKK